MINMFNVLKIILPQFSVSYFQPVISPPFRSFKYSKPLTFDVLLTVNLSKILAINQLNAQNLLL